MENGCAKMETKFNQVEDKDGNIGNCLSLNKYLSNMVTMLVIIIDKCFHSSVGSDVAWESRDTAINSRVRYIFS